MGFERMHLIDVFFEMHLITNVSVLPKVGECLVMYFWYKTGHEGGKVSKPSLFVIRMDNRLLHTALKTGRTQFRFPKEDSLGFLIGLILPADLWL